MKSLNEDLKTGQFKQIYLLYGEEAYLKKLYKNRFVKAMVPEGDTMNYRYFEGKNTNPKEIIDLAETLPFFAERRLIVLENTGFLKNATPELAEYLKNMPETTYMIFVESELDKRGKLYKAIKEKGHIVELKRQDEKTLIRWILGMAKKEKLQMSEAAVRYLLAKTGNDMENLGQELEKLFCYCMNHTEITATDIDEICTTQIGNHIFDMVDAVAAKEQKKALDYYYDLLTLKEPPMRILYLLTRQFRILMEVKEMRPYWGSAKRDCRQGGNHAIPGRKVPDTGEGIYQERAAWDRRSRCTDGRRCKNRKDGRYPLGGTLSGAVQ